MKLRHFFLPHPETHKKAHLISWQALFIYILLFVILRIGLDFYAQVRPGVLGVNSSINKESLIEYTNKERVKKGLPPLVLNEKLSQAAGEKAKNMFEENYWAHYSPSGKNPWGFIQSSGYKFTFAGENLARNFYTSEEVVAAWLASPSHRDNLLNPRFKDVGFAVVEGVLKGQKTTLVVQELGTPSEVIAALPQETKKQATSLQVISEASEQNVLVSNSSILDPYFLLKAVGFSIIGMLAALVLIDLYVIRRRAVYRISSRHMPHLALLSVAASALFSMSPGSIL
ncbi:MAG: hypothetical protein US86_C0001G0208 [Candidatus Daviesbacteria bacterium GW2011_GWA2_38_24]|uniref:SCP domain-containing protein n=1 Tax=Candidatus Daviesbacteria bacterium GW2011_GWA2_38_24 TaxID=1618422 RepID=A0A0G0MQT7_9BACT|nr:MAG: hypothetical protein US86_C0001G0208 [Candidatus Daviesbacteria bacterium GW2011_GWA2_38_24]KKQ79642.1 MAG: hypothetical protein UT01_C0032G0011 [Candidatus Daviesbacteria bacterium GW2011_GWA1_38_7]OGE23005.1 MAG: hypothetical protein A2688_03030 [Candidatus Daviesbacteria bacterium RIFCSPHIGHO2_01_FULL_38_8]